MTLCPRPPDPVAPKRHTAVLERRLPRPTAHARINSKVRKTRGRKHERLAHLSSLHPHATFISDAYRHAPTQAACVSNHERWPRNFDRGPLDPHASARVGRQLAYVVHKFAACMGVYKFLTLSYHNSTNTATRTADQGRRCSKHEWGHATHAK